MTRRDRVDDGGRGAPTDLPIRFLTWGLASLLIVAPLPFGSVGPKGRLLLEASSIVLGVVWTLRGLVLPTALPGRAVRIGLAGLLGLAAVQLLAWGPGVVAVVSPAAAAARAEMTPPADIADEEAYWLGVDPSELDRPAALSVDPPATASALRTGAALAILLLVATSVAQAGRAGTLVSALVVSAALQALYGLAVLASGHDAIWNVPKAHYLDSATGTFVNRNHFAAFVGAALCAGSGLVLARLRPSPSDRGAPARTVARLDARGSRTILLGVAAVLVLSGLLLSLSRAGIACGVSMTIVAILAGGRGVTRTGVRLAVIAVLILLGTVPLARLGAERLAERYARAGDDLRAEGGRPVVWADALGIVRSFPAVGVGFGAFATAYPQVRSAEVRSHYTHAHNDVVQLAAEGGLAGCAFALALVLPVAGVVVSSLAGRRGPLAVGVAAGLAALALHALIDFPFHIPATAALGAILAGTLLGLPCNGRV